MLQESRDFFSIVVLDSGNFLNTKLFEFCEFQVWKSLNFVKTRGDVENYTKRFNHVGFDFPKMLVNQGIQRSFFLFVSLIHNQYNINKLLLFGTNFLFIFFIWRNGMEIKQKPYIAFSIEKKFNFHTFRNEFVRRDRSLCRWMLD